MLCRTTCKMPQANSSTSGAPPRLPPTRITTRIASRRRSDACARRQSVFGPASASHRPCRSIWPTCSRTGPPSPSEAHRRQLHRAIGAVCRFLRTHRTMRSRMRRKRDEGSERRHGSKIGDRRSCGPKASTRTFRRDLSRACQSRRESSQYNETCQRLKSG